MTTRQAHLITWTLFCLLAGSVFVLYASASRAGGGGDWLMPLDDVYIHFQYARQLALGQPHVYNPGQPATSGATSFLYPYALAFGHFIGFHDLALGVWAMGIGALALLASMWAVYHLGRAANASSWLCVVGGVTLGLNGALTWHFMSGMETGLVCAFVLWTLYGFLTKRLRLFVLCATLLALMRPEASIMAAWASVLMAARLWRDVSRRRLLILLIPILALGVQPAMNGLVTGSSVASGNQSKSLFGLVPFEINVVIGRIIGNLTRLLSEFWSGAGEFGIVYAPFFIGPLALITVLIMLIVGRVLPSLHRGSGAGFTNRLTALLILGWWGIVALAASTLDTAFWHFKRYQMPIMILFFPLAMWGYQAFLHVTAHITSQTPPEKRFLSPQVQAVLGIVSGTLLPIGLSLVSFLLFWILYIYNVGYVAAQPLPMARWLAANTPPDAVVAVHDTGMMRYMGGRTTLDIVGLTTPNAAAYWRNGPGAVAEFLMQHQPDYIASYGKGHGYGLALIEQTSLYGPPLAFFEANIRPETNVALAADTQGIYQPNYAPQARRAETLQTSVLPYLTGFRLVDEINVADIASETAHAYRWSSPRPGEAYPTDVLEAAYLNCTGDCVLRDGGRHLTGGESFSVSVTPHEDVILVTRVNAMSRIEYNVYANGVFVGTRYIPRERGRWLDIPTFIPADLVTGSTLTITTTVNSPEGDYVPYYHLIYQGTYAAPQKPSSGPLVTFQDGAIQILDLQSRLHDDTLTLDVTWYTPQGAKGDDSVFIHLYPLDDEAAPQVAQIDVRPGGNALPAGNWLPGIVRDTMTLNLAALPEGGYGVALGLYHPVSFARLTPTVLTSDMTMTPDGRVFIDLVEIKR